MTTSTPTRPQHDTPPPSAAAPVRTRLELSATQLVATAFAAITATFAGSYLGVTGTVIGAALASVVTAIGNAVYGNTLRSTRDRVRAVVPTTRRSATGTAVLPAVADDPDGTRGSGDARPAPHPRPRPGSGRRRPDGPPELPSPSPRPHRAPSPVADAAARTWRRVALSAIAVFVAVIALVTGVEVVAGRPLADVVRGDSGSGTSLFGNNTGGTVTTPVPTVTRTVIPKIVVTTPTVTMTAPAKTVTGPATSTVTTAPTATATPTPSASSSASTSPSASSSGSGSSAAIP